MNFLESLIYGFLSGLAELLPISSQGHQVLMRVIFVGTASTGLRDFLVHLASLIAVIVGSYPYLLRLLRQQQLIKRNKSRRKIESRGIYEIKLIKTAAVPLLIGIVLCAMFLKIDSNMLLLGILFIFNGIVLFVQEHISHGNKDASKLTRLDGLWVGLSGAFSALPGISRIGTMSSAAIARGADKQRAFSWALILSIPALLLSMVLDLVTIFSSGTGVINFTDFIGCVVSAAVAFLGAYGGVMIMRTLTERSGYSIFAYYSWGAGLLSLILYLSA